MIQTSALNVLLQKLQQNFIVFRGSFHADKIGIFLVVVLIENDRSPRKLRV